jgi:4-hydroxy-tetrahydrodipicolinate reductase
VLTPAKVCLVDATGWTGSALAHSNALVDDIKLVAGVSRTYPQRSLGNVLAEPRLTCSMYVTAEE